jgi:hypothetical protein
MSLATNVTDLATRVATEAKALRTLINGNAADLSALNTVAKTNLVAAINEIEAAVSAASGIDDGTTSTTTTWSSSKIDGEIDAAVSALVDTAPGTLDTLNELAAALGDDPAFATTVTTALANRVRTDTAAQGLDSTQQGNARTNISAASASALTTLTTNVGDTTTNFVTTFEAGLV